MMMQNTGRGRLIGLVILYCSLAATTAFAQERRPSLAVIEFDVRARVNRDVGRDLSDMLVNALLDSQRFTVVDRSKMGHLQQEQILALQGTVDASTGAEVGKMLGAQFLVLGSVTEFSEKKAGASGLLSGLPGANKISSFQATVKFNLRVIHSTTGEITFSKAVEKQVKDTGVVGDSQIFGVPPGETFTSKAMQKAVEEAVKDAVAALVERLGSAAPTPAGASVVAASASVPAAAVGSAVNCSHLTGNRAPKVMVVIPELHISRRIPDPAGETEIIRKLVEHRFNVVDQRQVAAIRDRERVLTALRNPAAAAALGIEFGADIIIIGEAFSETAGRSGNMISSRARVEARAIQTDTARILAADGKHGSGLDIAEFVSAKAALRNAGSMWADYFVGQMCQAPRPGAGVASAPTPAGARALVPAAAAATSSVEILIANVGYAELKRFTDTVAKLPGVAGVEKKLTGNVARVDVQYSGTAERLADAIAETRFGTMKVNIVGLSGSKIEISIPK